MPIQNRILDNPAIPRKLKLALMALALFIDESGRNDPTLRRLSEITGYEINHLRRQLVALAHAGLIVVERKRNPEGRRANHYKITLPETVAA